MITVIKVGSSILKNYDCFLEIAEKLMHKFADKNPVFVISAVKGITQDLINKSMKIDPNSSSSFSIAAGEQIAAGMFSQALNKLGYDSLPLNAFQVPIIGNSEKEGGSILSIGKEKIKSLVKSGIVPIVTGFQAITELGDLTTLKRGGSDFTAVFFAKELKAECVLIKDSCGICSADPNEFDESYLWPKISYDDLTLLAQNGLKIVQEDSAYFSRAYLVPLKVESLENEKHTKVVNLKSDFWFLGKEKKEDSEKIYLLTNKNLNRDALEFFESKKNGRYELKTFHDTIGKDFFRVHELVKRIFK